MATTTNYGWTTPDDTALVKDGASAIRTLGSSIDTTTKALNPSTTLGDIEYRSSTSNTNTRLGIGTTGQVLTVSGGVPAWTTISSGGMTLLTSGTLSGASVALTSISGSYKDLRLIIKNFKPATDSASMNMRINNDSNSRYANPVTGGTGTFGATEWDPIAANDDTVAYGFTIIDIYDYANTTTWKTAFTRAWGTDPTTTTSYNLRLRYSIYNQTTAITELNLFPNTGNFTSGNYYLYGVN